MNQIDPFIYVFVFVGALAFAESIFLFLTSGDQSRQKRHATERLKRHRGLKLV